LQTSSSKKSSKKPNMFDTLLKPSTSSSNMCDEIDRYLTTDTEEADDVLAWWWERRSMYPSLSRMALDYLSIPVHILHSKLSNELFPSYIC